MDQLLGFYATRAYALLRVVFRIGAMFMFDFWPQSIDMHTLFSLWCFRGVNRMK